MTTIHPPRPTYCLIDGSAIAHNVRRVRAIIGPGPQILAVVKADGYGHGAVGVSRAALGAGVTWLGVACGLEGAVIRAAGIDAPILVLGWTPAGDAPAAVADDLTMAVYDIDLARAYAAAAREQGRHARVHVKVDTGMGRLGVLPGEALEFVRALRGIDGLSIDGIFTHLPNSDLGDQAYTLSQLARFNDVLVTLAAAGVRPPRAHAANSPATLIRPEARFDMVRAGIALLGLDPSDEVPCPPDFRPALEWKSALGFVRLRPAGTAISYGGEYVTRGAERIGVVPVGYADGFRRVPKNVNEVLAGGRRVPVVGRVCMDQIMVNVTSLPEAKIGDEVVLLGRQGDERISAADLARRWGTNVYDVVCGIRGRVPRVYLIPYP